MKKVHLVLGAEIESDEPLALRDYCEGDITVGADRGALALLRSDYPLHLAVGDFDSVTNEEWLAIAERATEVIKVPAEKDFTDGELALKTIGERKDESTPIFIYHWQTSGRLDHFLSILWWCYQPDFQSFIEDCHFVSGKNEMQFLLPGTHNVPNRADFQYISIIQMTPVKQLAIRGLKYELPAQDINYPRAWISNEPLIGDGELSFEEGILLLMYTKDE